MRITSSLMNGALIGFGIGFIAASLALNQVVKGYMPKDVSAWQFRGVAIVGGVGLLVGLGFEIYEWMKAKKQSTGEEETEE